MSLFLLDMGLIAGRGMKKGRRARWLGGVAFGVLMAVLGSAAGLAAGLAVGLSTGGTALLMVLPASAS